MKTNIGKRFFAILKKNFPPGHPLEKLFNKKTMKLSYSCLPSMKAIISSHNKYILKGPPATEGGCNCNSRTEQCPMPGRCATQSLVYKGTVNSSEGEREYIGQTHVTFKKRWRTHNWDSNHIEREHSTGLNTYIWQLKRKNLPYEIAWSPVSVVPFYTSESERCNLCNTEKTLIAMQDRDRGLNKRGEVMQKCIHKEKAMLSNWKAGGRKKKKKGGGQKDSGRR